MKYNPWVIVATGFGLGLSPVASGTFGALLGIPLAMALFSWQTNVLVQVVICAVLAVVSVPICDKAEKALGGKKDDGRIVADEYLTVPITLIGLPLHPVMLVVAFLTHRILDIIKPPPARGLQRLPGGLGITIDDVISSIYALGFNWLIYLYLLQPKGWV